MTWRPTYHGLARAVVQTTLDATSPHRDLLREIDVDRTPIVAAEPAEQAAVARARATGIVVEATAPGFPPASVTIAVSDDPDGDGVLAVARRSVAVPIAIG